MPKSYVVAAFLIAMPIVSAPLRAAELGTVVQVKLSTQEYVQKAARANLFEIESSKLALEKGQGAPVKEFAQQMVEDMNQAGEKLKGAVGETTGVSVPSKLDGEHAQLLEQLKDAKGMEFDKLYLDFQIKGQEEALTLHQSYAESGDDAALKMTARELVPVVASHLEKVREIAGTPSRS
jgi:putative membrane protein